ncbi:MAG: HisA/HisF-related TIM barrel protein [Chloroflexales bacterium]|nr:HisA/HisF-related TIM barrel protein [Chloroflexales bacterium]
MPIELAPKNPYSLTLHTPVIAGAGTLGYGVECARQLGLANEPQQHGLGALVTRSTTLQPQRAWPLPRIVEAPAGIISSGSEHNPGLRYVTEHCASIWAGWSLPVIISIVVTDMGEFVSAAAQLEGSTGVAGIELDLAITNTHSPAYIEQLVTSVRTATLLPLLIKLPLDLSHLVNLAEAATNAGADAIVVSNSLPGLTVEPATGEHICGWLCGPALRPFALDAVAAVAQAIQAPVVGGGGIMTVEDARQFLAVGASAVSLDAALLVDFRIAVQIATELGID